MNLSLLNELTGVLNIANISEGEDISHEVEKLIEERKAAKKDRDFAKADDIREKLKNMGIEIEDTRQGTKWKRIN